jgi:hypothetical protein
MQSARPPRCWSELLLLKHPVVRWICISGDDACSGRRAACELFISRHGCLYRKCRFNALSSRRGDRSTLVDEKRTRFLKHFVEFFGGHFSN